MKTISRRAATAATTLAAALTLAPAAHAQSWSAAKTAALNQFVDSALQTAAVPGASVAVVFNGQIVYQRAVGVKDRAAGGTVDNDTQFMMGSVSKPVTTMMMASVVDSGAADWTTRAQSILPAFRVADSSNSSQITLRDLVCNCVGAPRKDFELIYRANSLTPNGVIGSVADYAVDPIFGTRFTYNNQLVATGGWLAAAAAAGITGDLGGSYAAQLQTRVLDKIGMASTTSAFDRVASRGNFAKPHGIDLSWLAQPQALSYESFAAGVAPSGGLWTTSGDMARFVITQLQRGVAPTGLRVASEANLLETWKPRVAVASGVSYGLGLYIADNDNRRTLFHDGNTLGFSSAMVFLPDHNVGVVALANRQQSLFGLAVRARAVQLLFDQPDTVTANFNARVLQEQMTIKAFGLESTNVDQAKARPYLGAWRNTGLGGITVQANGTTLDYAAQSFTVTLREQRRTDGQLFYRITTPPLAGALVQASGTNALTVTHGDNVPYGFSR
jgi:CubicO group peptidase (beta-lactamase class C family)